MTPQRILPVAAIVAAALVAGCGGSDDPATTAAADRGAAPGGPFEFAKCMREQGVDFPDPEVSDDGRRIRMRPGQDTDPDDPKVQAAQQACEQHLDDGGPLENASPEERERVDAAMLRFASCMRSHGVENFPDPVPGKGIRIGPGSGIDPEDPAFARASKACEDEAPAPLGAP